MHRGQGTNLSSMSLPRAWRDRRCTTHKNVFFLLFCTCFCSVFLGCLGYSNTVEACHTFPHTRSEYFPRNENIRWLVQAAWPWTYGANGPELMGPMRFLNFYAGLSSGFGNVLKFDVIVFCRFSRFTTLSTSQPTQTWASAAPFRKFLHGWKGTTFGGSRKRQEGEFRGSLPASALPFYLSRHEARFTTFACKVAFGRSFEVDLKNIFVLA